MLNVVPWQVMSRLEETVGLAIAPGKSPEGVEPTVIQTRFFYIFAVFLTVDCVSRSEVGADFPALGS